MSELPFDPTALNIFKHVELEINTACDLACFACDRFSDVTTDLNMTVGQVALFFAESKELNWEWERIRLLGGEPTLHPDFQVIAEMAIDYRNEHPACFLQVLSNGNGKHARWKDFCAQHNISLHVEGKSPGVQPAWFNNTRITPVDRDPSVGELPPCGIFDIRGCGIGLTRYGYFLDGAGASAARVAGHDIGKQSLREVTWQAMQDQAKVLCRICGHWNPTSGPVVTELVSKTGQVTGPFWTKKLAEYKVKKPAMTVYGSSKTS